MNLLSLYKTDGIITNVQLVNTNHFYLLPYIFLQQKQYQEIQDLMMQVEERPTLFKKKKNVKVVQGIPYYISEEEQLGRGCFGKVVRAYNKDDYSQQLVAKIIPVQSSQLIQSIKSQIEILKELPYHRNLVNCKKLQICTQNNFYLIMQYCNGGSFQKYITQNANIQQEKIWDFLKQFCRGYQVLYDNQILHRDIKPQNILIHNGVFKIADFGLAKKFNRAYNMSISIKGTPVYMAPELFYGQAKSAKIDVFSLGVVLFRLAYRGKFPFGTHFASTNQYVQKLPTSIIEFPKFPKRSQQLVNLIKRMLEMNQQKRISWEQIFQHPKIAINQFQRLQNNHLDQQEMIQLDKAMNRLGQSMLEVKRSVAQIKHLPLKHYSRQQIFQHTTNLMELEMFMTSQQLKQFQLVVWKGKILHLSISYVNTKINSILSNESLHLHIKNLLNKSIKLGYLFAFQVLNTMKQQISKGQQNLALKSVLTMIQNDESVITSLLQKFDTQAKSDPKIRQEFPQHLYGFITEYWQYPSQLKQNMKVVISILADIYDSGIRFFDKEFSAQETNALDMIPCKQFRGFASYLHNKQKISFEMLEKSLKKLGLLFL